MMADTYLATHPTASGTASSGGGLSGGIDWLNNAFSSLGKTALKGYDTYYKVKSLSAQANNSVQKQYQDSTQAVGSKNLIHGIDNNYILLGIAGVVGLFIVMEG